MNNTENTIDTPRKSVNLNICGGNRTLVDYELVKAVPTPPVEFRNKPNKRTGEHAVSYQPIAHHEVVNRTKKFLGEQGFSIQDEVHSLARANQHYFGLFAVDHPNRAESDRGCVVGIRNSHDKTFLQDFAQVMLLSFATILFLPIRSSWHVVTLATFSTISIL